MHNLYIAKESGTTKKNNIYTILQDSPTTFHITIQIKEYLSYDFLSSPPNLESIHRRIEELETELEEKYKIQYEPLTENNNETVA